MIYFDNSATSRPKPKEVLCAVNQGLTALCSNPTRSGHFLAMQASQKLEEVRAQVKFFVGARQGDVCVFTHNCTHALNIAILGTFAKGDHVITTVNEHNSVLRPLFELEKQGVSVSIAPCNNSGVVTANKIAPLIQPNTKAVVANHICNVNGDTCELSSVGTMCKQRNLLLIVDGAQSAGHKKINMAENNITMLALAGHKGLLGPQGIGCLVFDHKFAPSPIMFGGTGTSSLTLTQPTELPEALEVGTLALPSILGLGAGIGYVSKHLDTIEGTIAMLTQYTLAKLSLNKKIKLKTEPNQTNGVIAFEVPQIDSVLLSQALSDQYLICTRPGLHCAPLKHKSLGTQKNGLVRASLSHYNTKQEIDTLATALKQLLC